jgi:glucosylceramidase
VGVWVTTGDRARLLAADAPLALEPAPAAPEGTTIAVDPSVAYQEMVGFGAAFTDASTWLIERRLGPRGRRRLLTELFHPTQGIGLSFMRMTMGSSDFSRSHWSYDDVPAGQTDPGLAHFTIERDREAMLPVIRRARELNPALRVMASPWSAPGWMKTSGSMIRGSLLPGAYDPFARYFLRFLQAYRAEGVEIWGISVQNEPHFEPDTYPGMRIESPERAAFLAGHLGPLLEASGFGGVRVLEWDHNWDQPFAPLEVLADPAAARYVDGVAWHCYQGDPGVQSTVRDAHPDRQVFVTECSGGEWEPDFADNLRWFTSTLVIGATRNWASGVLLWNLALDPGHGPFTGGCGNCRGVVTIDPATGRVTRNVEFYVLGHASRFVLPGAHRIASSGPVDGVENVAFRNPDGALVVVALNGATEARAFAVSDGARRFHYTLPAGAVATFRWR